CDELLLTGILDGPLSGGQPKAIELYATQDITDLSSYGLELVSNGNGSNGIEEFTFPAVSVTAGTYIYVASNTADFNAFFGFNPDYTDGTVTAFNGDDALILYKDSTAVDVFGDPNVDGTGQPWEYKDGWAYRKNSSSTHRNPFEVNDYTYSGPNALDGETSNNSAATPWPIGTYAPSCGTAPPT